MFLIRAVLVNGDLVTVGHDKVRERATARIMGALRTGFGMEVSGSTSRWYPPSAILYIEVVDLDEATSDDGA